MQPIQEQYRRMMSDLARHIDVIFNGDKKGLERKTGFALVVFPFGDAPKGRVNYISNANREDMIVALKEFIARNEGRYHEPEKKQ